MKQVVIDNPIINSPFHEPTRHFRFDDGGITDGIFEARRAGSYFMPIAQPRNKGKLRQLAFDTEWTQKRMEENRMLGAIRRKVKEAKVAAARNLWVPAVNSASAWGQWAFVEVSDPWDAKNTIRRLFTTGLPVGGAWSIGVC